MTIASSNASSNQAEGKRGAAMTPTPAQLLALWQETLGAPDATPEENFFDAGGTSLLAARLAAKIKAQLGCVISAADILAHPTVRQLARKLGGHEPGLDRSASDRRAAMQRRAFPASRPGR